MTEEEIDALLQGTEEFTQRTAPERTAAVINAEAEAFFTTFTQERDTPNPEKPWMKHHKFVMPTSVEEVKQIVDAAIASGHCALDLETEGLDNRIRYDAEGNPFTVHKIVGYCLCYDGLTGYYIPVGHHVDEDDPNVRPVADVESEIRKLCLASQPVLAEAETDKLGGRNIVTPPRVVIGFWHAKFDQEFLYPITGIDWWHPESFEDGNLAGFTILSSDKNLSLKAKSKERLHDPDGNPYEQIELKELFLQGRPIKFATLDPREPGVLKYAGADAICTFKHCFEGDLMTQAKSQKHLFTYRLEKQCCQALRVMERCQVKIDRDEVVRVLDEAQLEQIDYAKKIDALAKKFGFNDFNPASGKQLSDFLFGEHGLKLTPKPEKTSEGSDQYKTDAKTLEGLIDTLPDEDATDNVLVWIVKLRQIGKIVGTYLEGMLESLDTDNQVRVQFKQTGAATGRFSAPSGDPADGACSIPMHGIPARFDPKRPKCANSLRRVFVARDGYTLVKCDYAGQELRIVANVSGEPVWAKEFLEGEGDLHSITARAFFGKAEVTKEERSRGKSANFALVYGGGPSAIMRTTGCDKVEAGRRKKAFDKSVPVFAKWVVKQQEEVKKTLGITNAFNRFIAIPDANTRDNALRAACERYAVNFPIQSAGADIMKISMVLLMKKFATKGWLRNGGDDSVRMLLTVHDELVFEIRHDLVSEALPVIVSIMESPAKIARPPWKIPLIVDPVLGHSWECAYDWAKMKDGRKAKAGEKLKDTEYQVGDQIYQKVPTWLEGLLPFDKQSVSITTDMPSVVDSSVEVLTVPTAVIQAPVDQVNTTSEAVPVLDKTSPETVTFCIETLTRNTIRLVTSACHEAQDLDEGKILHLVSCDGSTLISPQLKVQVDPTLFAIALRNRGLGNGIVKVFH